MSSRRPNPPERPTQREAERNKRRRTAIHRSSLAAGSFQRKQRTQTSLVGGCLGIVLGVAVIVLLLRYNVIADSVIDPWRFADLFTTTAPVEATVAVPAVPAQPLPAGTIRTVASPGLHLREQPDAKSQIIAELAQGQQVTLLGETRKQGNDLWVNVRIEGREGWVNSGYLK